MFDPQRIVDSTSIRLNHLAARATASDSELWSVTATLPPFDLSLSADLPAPFFYWSRPQQRHQLLGLELARSVRLPETATPPAESDERLLRLAAAFEELKRGWRHVGETHVGAPVAFVGFAFDAADPMRGLWQGIPNCGLFVPSILLRRMDDRCSVTFTADAAGLGAGVLDRWSELLHDLLSRLIRPINRPLDFEQLQREQAEPADDRWLALVDQARREIRAHRLDKVVPARRIAVRSGHPLSAERAMAILARAYPSCALVAARLDESTLVAATPERLIASDPDGVVSDAVGGTVRRGDEAPEDQALASMLLESVKARHEHELVVQFIRDALESFCDSVEGPAVPNVVRLRNVQHLWTPLRGKPHAPVSPLRIAARLHPTPAVAGLPSDAARRWLHAHEPLQRGWYTGGFGWLDANDEGELSVVLRCALLKDNRADLYAGAGVVGDSDPQAELEETELKLEALLGALADLDGKEERS